MKTNAKILLAIIIIIIFGLVIFLMANYSRQNGQNNQSNNPSDLVATASYVCDNSKTIEASYYKGATPPPVVPGQPPVPTGSVSLVLSDGRTMTLAQTLSADGTRYANTDESFVFWGKGNGAMVLENGQEKNYKGCIEVKPKTDDLGQVYQNGAMQITLRYPAGYTVNNSYVYQAMGPNKGINGVSFTIPASLATGTNLGSDSYISVEQIPNKTDCSASYFVGAKVASQTISDNGTDYSLATTTDAGAGNRYEELVYALPGTNPCLAVRYFIHYSVFENYPAGTVKQFDKQAILNQFDQIRRSLVIDQQL